MRLDDDLDYRSNLDLAREIAHDALLVFDTSVLVELHVYDEPARRQFLDVLETVKDRIWIPFQTKVEYQARVRDLANRYAIELKQYNDRVNQALNAANATPPPNISYQAQPVAEVKKIVDEAKTKVKTLIVQKEAALKHLSPLDESFRQIKNEIADLFDGRIGAQFSDEHLAKIHSEGASRYVLRVPPGYEDANKPRPDCFGDLVAWKAILEEAESRDQPFIFVTGDVKRDWFQDPPFAKPDQPNQPNKGRDSRVPHPLLLDEAKRVVGRPCTIVTDRQFLEEIAPIIANIHVSEEVLAEVEATDLAPQTTQAVTRSLERASAAFFEWLSKQPEYAEVGQFGDALAGSINSASANLASAASFSHIGNSLAGSISDASLATSLSRTSGLLAGSIGNADLVNSAMFASTTAEALRAAALENFQGQAEALSSMLLSGWDDRLAQLSTVSGLAALNIGQDFIEQMQRVQTGFFTQQAGLLNILNWLDKTAAGLNYIDTDQTEAPNQTTAEEANKEVSGSGEGEMTESGDSTTKETE